MHKAVVGEIVRLGGDPADDVWIWLVTCGPHGPSFTWGQARREPPGHVGVLHLERRVDELASSIPSFRQRALGVVNLAMNSPLPELARRAIQVAAVVGGEAELSRLERLAPGLSPSVAADARACLFFLKHRR